MHTHHPAVPIHFGVDERALFGWLHPPRAPARACGVVVCNPIGDDVVRAHRVLRHLAERLQRAGFFVVRFDFHGTGDSSGDECDGDRVATWLADIGQAIDELRARGGVARVALAGLRLGATLAVCAAAARGDVDDLLLFSPYADGAAFVNHVTRMHKVHRLIEPQSFALDPPGFDPGGQEALGFVLTAETIAALRRLDLSTLARRPARRALLLGAGAAADAKLATALRGLGCAVDQRSPADERFLITIAHRATLPERELDTMVRWLADAHDTHATAASAIERAALAPPGREEPLVLPGAAPLFGILSSPPPAARARDRPAIVLLNAGTVHRIGPHRMYVRLARRWAERGFFVLRLDLSGIGDSPAPPSCHENLCYPRDAIADAQAAMTALGKRLGVRRFVVGGLCSGGDIAFQTGLRDKRVASTIIMNPRTFLINDLELVENYQRPRYYLEALGDRKKLMRLLRGEVDIKRALAALYNNVVDLLRRRRATRATTRSREDVPTSLGRLAGRGVDTLLLVTAQDPGVAYVDSHFGAGMRALEQLSCFRRIDIPGTDHTFTSVYAQRFVAETLTRHIVEHHLS
jgi:pimeloyl-ACP methyl ester carboxylesterase